MRSLFHSGPPNREPFSLLKNPIPMPEYMINDQMNNLPANYQNQEVYRQIRKQNDKAIKNQFQQILKAATNGMPSNLSSSSKHQITYNICQNLKKSDARGLQYAQHVQKVGYDANNVHMQNGIFAKKLLNQILNKHAQIYAIYPIPQEYYTLINNKMHRKRQSNGFLSCFSKKRSFQRVQEDKQINKVIMADRNVKNLRDGINNPDLFKKSQNLPFNPTQALVSQTLLNSHSNKIHYNEQTFHKLANDKKNGLKPQIYNGGDVSRLSFYQSHALNHLNTIMTPQHTKSISKVPYIQSAYNYINSSIFTTSKTAQQNKQFQILCKQVIGELKQAENYYDQNNWGSDDKYYQISSWMIIMIHIYKFMADSYDPFRRRVLKNLFVAFTNAEMKRPVEVLRWLENHRLQILELNSKETYDDVISKSASLLLQVHKDRINFLEQHKLQSPPKLSLIHLSDKKMPRRKTVNIWVSGFLSEDMSKKSQWGQLLEYMPDSQAYALQWESDSIINLVKFMGSSCKDLLTGNSIKEELKKKFADNPFIPAFETAKYSGRYLAQVVIRLFPNQFINIAGYSLGSELIKQFLQRMIEVGAQNRLSNIYMMGGVSDRKELAGIIMKSKYPLSIYNCYTDNDMVLKYVLNQCKPECEAIGSFEVDVCPGHHVINADVSDIISGHLAYMSEFDIVGQLIDMEKE